MKTKRGMSPVIATVLIILLTIAAVAIIAGILIPFTRNSLTESTECLPYIDYFKFEESFDLNGEEFRYNCYNESLYGASVRANSDEDLYENIVGFDLSFIVKGGDSVNVKFRNGTLESCNPGGIKALKTNCTGSLGNINITKPGEVRTYIYFSSSGERYDKSSINPIIKDKTGKEKICEV